MGIPSIIFCCGMSRSGSTVQYQITKEIAESHVLSVGMGFGIGFKGEDAVIKTEPPKQHLIRLVEEDVAIAIGIYRDPRDVAASLMKWREKKGKDGSFEGVTEEWQNAIIWWNAWEPLCSYRSKYENVHPDKWYLEVLGIADILGVKMNVTEARLIAKKWSIKRNLARQEKQSRWMDFGTMLTEAHVSDTMGMSVWRDVLTDEQAHQVIEFAGEDWMKEHGYSILDS